MPRESDESLAERIFNLRGVLADSPVYCWDLDSTVCSTVHRRHMVPAIKEGLSTWDDYAMACPDDIPIAGTVALMRELKGTHIAISGRSALAEDLTYAWLEKHAVPLDAVILRAHGDHTPNGKYKVRVLKTLRATGADIRLFFEDWDEAAKEIAEGAGIPVVGINPFDPAELGERQGAL